MVYCTRRATNRHTEQERRAYDTDGGCDGECGGSLDAGRDSTTTEALRGEDSVINRKAREVLATMTDCQCTYTAALEIVRKRKAAELRKRKLARERRA